MNVKELKQALRDHGASTIGLKQELIERLDGEKHGKAQCMTKHPKTTKPRSMQSAKKETANKAAKGEDDLFPPSFSKRALILLSLFLCRHRVSEPSQGNVTIHITKRGHSLEHHSKSHSCRRVDSDFFEQEPLFQHGG